MFQAVTNFLIAQLDYIYFVYGLSFFLFGLIAFALWRKEKGRQFWLLLGLFGVVHGLCEWSDLITNSFPGNSALELFATVACLVSFMFLVELARGETERIYQCNISRGVIVFMLALVCIGIPVGGGILGAKIFSRYVFGFIGASWAAFIIFKNSSIDDTKDSEHRVFFIRLSIVFVLYAISQLVVHAAAFPPASFINQANFIKLFGFPVQLFRTVLAFAGAYLVFIYYQRKRTEVFSDKYLKKGYFFERFIVSVLAFILATGFIGTNLSGKNESQNDHKRLIDMAIAMSASIDPIVVKHLAETPSDSKDETYLYLKSQLERVCVALKSKTMKEIRSFYITLAKGDEIIVGVDSCPINTKGFLSPGSKYGNSLDVKKVFSVAKAMSSERPFFNEEGLSISGIAPIIDFESGGVVGAINVVVDVVAHNRIVAAARLWPIVITFLFVACFLIFSFAWLKMREVEEDITQQRLIERKLRLLAESASQTKGQFLANMSHEIRTPMNAVIGFSDLLLQTDVNPQQKEYLNIITDSGQVLIRLIDDILDVSKIEAGQLRLEEMVFDMEYLVESVMKMVRPRLKDKDIELLLDVDSGIPMKYIGDPTRIRQIFLNILNNAIKFTSRGYVKLSIEKDQSFSQEGPYYVLLCTIEDTGIGISDDKKEKIFEAFTQADSSTTRQYGGAGLGLYITKMLVEKMDGSIKIESMEGKGSKFIFSLRFKKVLDQTSDGVVLLDESELPNKKIAVLDDSKESLHIVEKYLQQAGFKIVHVTDSAYECFNWLKNAEELPDVILCDILMPEMDGYTFARAVSADARFNQVKLVAMTSEAMPGTGALSEKSGFDGYLPKPIVKGDLKKVLQAVLGKMGDGDKDKPIFVTRHTIAESALSGAKVLVVEDNPVNLKLTTTILERFGCEVDGVFTGEEALQKIKNKEYKVIIMDLQMPGMGGLEASFIIRRDISKTIPIIGLSAAALKEDEAAALAMGMNDYLTKPVSALKLKEKLFKWMGGEQP